MNHHLLLSLVLLVLALASSAASVFALTASDQLAATNDVTVLNYALTLEHLESTFYNEGLAKFNATDFTDAGYNSSVYWYLQMVQSHEASHVVFLTAVIDTASYGSAVPACTYNFSAALLTPETFIATAAALENAGQTAYDGAISGITNPIYAQVAAQIATVEARHAAYLNWLTGVVPFPSAFDTANLPAIIAEMIAPFLVSCPYNITLPTIRPSGVALISTNSTNSTSSDSTNSTNEVVATGSLNASYTTAQQDNDIVALNYALTLENFESAFYQYILSIFTFDDFVNAGLPSYYYNYTEIIAGHEQLHAATLELVINSRQPNASVPVCTYNFTSVTTIAQYLEVAMLLENTGVTAYDGAVNTITDTNLQTVAATIATVEARHAAFLNYANGVSPFPTDQDNATSPELIIEAVVATGFISCPYTPVGPVVLTTTNATTNSTSDFVSSSTNIASVSFVALAATALMAVCSLL